MTRLYRRLLHWAWARHTTVCQRCLMEWRQQQRVQWTASGAVVMTSNMPIVQGGYWLPPVV